MAVLGHHEISTHVFNTWNLNFRPILRNTIGSHIFTWPKKCGPHHGNLDLKFSSKTDINFDIRKIMLVLTRIDFWICLVNANRFVALTFILFPRRKTQIPLCDVMWKPKPCHQASEFCSLVVGFRHFLHLCHFIWPLSAVLSGWIISKPCWTNLLKPPHNQGLSCGNNKIFF